MRRVFLGVFGLVLGLSAPVYAVPSVGGLTLTASKNTKYFVAFGGAKGCIPFGSTVDLTANGGNFYCAWTMSSSTSISFTGSTANAAACALSDTRGPSGPASCIEVPTPVPTRIKVSYAEISQSVGHRDGICSSAITAVGGAPRRQGCYATTECGAGTCGTDSSSLLPRLGCAYLICQGDTDSTSLFASVQP